MNSKVCVLCMYAKNLDYDLRKVSCMLDNYHNVDFEYYCNKFKRDYNRSIVTTSGGTDVNKTK